MKKALPGAFFIFIPLLLRLKPEHRADERF